MEQGCYFCGKPLASKSRRFPQHKSAVNGVQGRLWDLLPVIRSPTYHIDYRGSFSLKDVLPALVPKMTYEGRKRVGPLAGTG